MTDFLIQKNAILVVAWVLFAFCCEPAIGQTRIPTNLLGDWSLQMESQEPAWMSLTEDENGPMALMRVYIGSAGPYPIQEVENGIIKFSLRPKRKKKGNPKLTQQSVEVSFEEGKLTGKLIRIPNDGTESKVILFTGKRIPEMSPAAPDLTKVQFGEKIRLFNGKDLTGWKTYESDKINGWSVIDSMLVNITPKTDFSATGAYANLRTVEEFEDFRLHIEFLVEKNRNSGIYLRGMYEAQVVDRDSRMQGIQGVGAIFNAIAPSKNAGKPSGQWQTYDLILVDRHITVVLNGETVIDNQPVRGPTAGAIYTDPSAPGPIYLQGDHTSVRYRNIFLEPVVR